jgi:hypothetical protein
MTLQILQKGIQSSIPMDQTGFTGVIATDVALAVVTKMVAGRLAAINTSTGLATLADGTTTNNLEPIGFIINNAAGYFFENVPAYASDLIAVTMGPCVVITDQISPSITFAPGQKVYCDTGSNVGLITNAPGGTGARLIGIAGSAASAASPSLTIFVI